MKIYRAETGQQVEWRNAPIDTLEQLKLELENCTGVPADCQILMTSFGTQVRPDQVATVVSAVGQDEYLVFIYDRHYLGASEEEISTLLDVETPVLEPRVTPLDVQAPLSIIRDAKDIHKDDILSLCDTFLQLFGLFDSHSQTLTNVITAHTDLARAIVEEQKAQSMALNVAMTNLESHNYAVSDGIRSFCLLADKDVALYSSLVDAVDLDLVILRDVIIHPSVYQLIQLDPEATKESLIDFVDHVSIMRAKQETADICQRLRASVRELNSVALDLQECERNLEKRIANSLDLQTLDTAVLDIREVQGKARFFRDKVKRDRDRVYHKIAEVLQVHPSDLGASSIQTLVGSSSTPDFLSDGMPPTLVSHAKKTFEALTHLADIHLADYISKLTSYESNVRSRVVELARTKRRSIERFIANMSVVSHLQSEIAGITPRLDSANKDLSDFKETQAAHTLEIPHQALYAYGTLLIEIVRRKEYATILVENAATLADLLANLRAKEQDRRDLFTRNITTLLPFKLKDMDVSAAQCEVSATTENTQNIEIDRSAVVEFIKLLAQQYSSGKRPRFAGTGDSPTRRMAGTSLQQLSSPAQPGVSRLLAQQQQQQQQKGSDLGGDKFIDLLNNMNKQMDSLRSDFLTALEDAFFGGEGAVRTSNSLAYSRVADVEYQQKAKALTRAEERLKAYESRIGSLEKALQQKRLPVSNERSQSLREGSSVSSTYSILEDEGKKADADELEKKLLATEKRYGEVERRCTELVQELDQHKDALRKRNALLESMNEDWASEQEEWRKMKEKLEQEKEEMRLQIQELEQLLEEERQTYEENRRSFLREVQIQDNLADIRVAGVEDDWRSKMQDLEKQLEQERQENERLRVEHQKEIERLEKKSRDEQAQAQAEKAELQDVLEKREEHYAKLESINQDTEQAREDIKRRFAQAREMVANAENSWREKQQLLDTMTKEREDIRVGVLDLLAGFDCVPENPETKSLLDLLKECTDGLGVLYEECAELRSMARLMAERLEDFRKGVVYQVTKTLHLPVDEEEAGMISRRITLSEEDPATWNQALQVANLIDAGKFVERIRKKVKDAHELTRRWQKEYHDLKDKYTKAASSAREKIAFRNFKVGDVALFLPTRNASGKPWAAFNINAPHYFLKPSDTVAEQMNTREWIVARITSITESTADPAVPDSNPYGLASGLHYYQLEVELWKSSRAGKSQRRSKQKRNSSRESPQAASPSQQQQELELEQGLQQEAAGLRSSTSQQLPLSNTPPRQDTGLASISLERRRLSQPGGASMVSTMHSLSPPMEDAALSESQSTPSYRHPSYPLSMSSSNVVHSYVPPTSPPSASHPERRKSAGYFSQESALDPAFVWTSQE